MLVDMQIVSRKAKGRKKTKIKKAKEKIIILWKHACVRKLSGSNEKMPLD